VADQRPNKLAHLDWLRTDTAAASHPAAARPSGTMEIPYRPALGKTALAAVFFGFGAVIMGHAARTNDRGLILIRLIELSVSGAAIFYWVICYVCLAFVAVAVLFALPQAFIPRRILLEPDAITVPGWGFSTRHYRIPRDEIRGASVSSYHKYRFLKITTLGGSKTINSSMLPHEGDFDVIVNWLDGPAARQTPPAPAR
jgi:hypothetical protein